jgi:hypothetical protein
MVLMPPPARATGRTRAMASVLKRAVQDIGFESPLVGRGAAETPLI